MKKCGASEWWMVASGGKFEKDPLSSRIFPFCCCLAVIRTGSPAGLLANVSSSFLPFEKKSI
jgi:hypothetical protein